MDKTPTTPAEHPSYGDLLQLTVLPQNVREEVRAQIEAHLKECLECTEAKSTMEGWTEEDRETAEQIETMDWNQLVKVCEEAIAQDSAATLTPIVEKCIRALEQDRNNAAALDILTTIAQQGAGVAKPRAENWLMKNGITLVKDLN